MQSKALVSALAWKPFSIAALAGAASLLLVSIAVAAPAGSHELFQKALVAERTSGDLERAIDLYRRVIDESQDRSLTARALLRLGKTYEKLGREEARNAYQRLVREFSDQPEQVEAAEARLAALERPAPAPEPEAPTGPVARQVLADLEDSEGEISRDGRYLSYVSWDTGDIAVRDLETGDVRLLTDKGPWSESGQFAGQSRFSPDGRRLAYTWYDEDGQVDLRIVPASGGESEILMRADDIEYVEPGGWSPNGRRVSVGLTRTDGTTELGVVDVADGSYRMLKKADGRHLHPGWFDPDGRWLAYDFPPERDSNQRDVYLIGTDGKGDTRVAPHPSVDRILGFSADGEWLLFLSERTGSPGLWSVAVSDDGTPGEPELLRPDMGPVTGLGVTRSGAFYYGVHRQMRDGWIADLDESGLPGDPRRVSDRVGSVVHPNWSPDGERLVYLSRRDQLLPPSLAQVTLVVKDLSTGNERSLEVPLVVTGRQMSFTPDGESVLLQAEDLDERQGLFRVALATGRAELVIATGTEETEGIERAALSPDGKTMYLIRNGSAGDALVARDVATGEERVLYEVPRGLSGLAVSPDGEEIAVRDFTDDYSETDLILAVPTKGSEPREILREPVPRQGGNIHSGTGLVWTPDGEHILFGRWESWPAKPDIALYRVSAEGGAPEPLGITDMGQILDLRIHPDGDELAFTTRQGTGELWVMENFLPE